MNKIFPLDFTVDIVSGWPTPSPPGDPTYHGTVELSFYFGNVAEGNTGNIFLYQELRNATSNPVAFTKSGIYFGAATSVDFNASISWSGSQLRVQVTSSNDDNCDLYLNSYQDTSHFSIIQAGQNVAPWSGQTFSSKLNCSARGIVNQALLTEVHEYPGLSYWEVGFFGELYYRAGFNPSDLAYAPAVPPPAANEEGGYLGPILRTDSGIFRVTAVDGNRMTLELLEAPKRLIHETNDG